MADMTTIKGRIEETIYPNGTGAITAESHQALLLEMVDEINSKKQDNIEDIDAIRAGAKLGETALQELPDLSHLATKEEVKTELTFKANTDGKYPDLMAGDLVGRGESVPAEFSFRASGGKSIKDGTARIRRLKGNSVVWNQLLPNSTNIVTSSGAKALNEGTRIVAGHKYLLFADFDGGTAYASVNLYARVNGESKPIYSLGNNEGKTYKFVTAEIGGVSNGTNAAVEGNIWQYFYFVGTTESITNTRLIDLTKAFPNDWQNINTIEEFNARVATLGIDLYAYNEGEVIHMTAEGIKSVGDNAWDEEWEVNGSYISSKNYIRVIPNAIYYTNVALANGIRYYDKDYNRVGSTAYAGAGQTFIVPANVQYMTFGVTASYGTTYNNDIMITLVHSGWKQDTDAGYQPYWEDRLIFDQRIKDEFPDGMKKAGSAHDEIRFNKASGKWEAVQRIGSVDLGTLEWSRYADGFYLAKNLTYAASTAWGLTQLPNVVSSRYAPALWDAISESNRDKACSAYDSQVRVSDTDYTDAASFKAAMQGVILYYELAEPTIIEYDEPFNLDYKVADFGTEQMLTEQPSAPIAADIIYQFNAVDMIREHELEIAELQSIIATMQSQLASLTNKE